MENFKFDFSAKIVLVNKEGFAATLKDNYLIKFKDKKRHFFDVTNIINISIENSEIGNDEINQEYSIIYVRLSSYITNGIVFEDIMRKSFFSRGMLTHKWMESNEGWQIGSILKITILKI